MKWCKLPTSILKELPVRESVLMSLLMDRQSLSESTGFSDSEGNVAVVYTVREACEMLRCSKPTAIKAFRNLEEKGYIRRVRRGITLPDLIYVCYAEQEQEITPRYEQTAAEDVQEHSEVLEVPEPAEEHTEPVADEWRSEVRRGFISWWNEYPKKNCAGHRRAAWEMYKTAAGKYTVEELAKALGLYVAEIRANHTEDRYISLPENFLKEKYISYVESARSAVTHDEQYYENGRCYTRLGEEIHGYWLQPTEDGNDVLSVLADGRISEDVQHISGKVYHSPDGKYWFNSENNFNPFQSCFAFTAEEAEREAA